MEVHKGYNSYHTRMSHRVVLMLHIPCMRRSRNAYIHRPWRKQSNKTGFPPPRCYQQALESFTVEFVEEYGTRPNIWMTMELALRVETLRRMCGADRGVPHPGMSKGLFM